MSESASSERWIELVPGGDTTAPSYWWCAMRFMEGYKKFERLRSLISEVASGSSDYPAVRATRQSVEAGQPQIELSGPISLKAEQKREASILASELLFHVRSALDQLIYQAAWHDSGVRQDGTQFSICKSLNLWRNDANRHLRGMTDDHRMLIEAVQPYHGIEWSKLLAQLNNRDKHRSAVEVTPTLSIKVNFAKLYNDPLGDPNYVGYMVEEPQIKCRLIPAEHAGEGDERVEAIEAFSSILRGSADLLNQFLAEEGLDLLIATSSDGK